MNTSRGRTWTFCSADLRRAAIGALATASIMGASFGAVAMSKASDSGKYGTEGRTWAASSASAGSSSSGGGASTQGRTWA